MCECVCVCVCVCVCARVCVCLNERSIVNKENELIIMVQDINPHIIGITELWANKDIAYGELGLTGYALFRGDQIGRKVMGIIYILRNIFRLTKYN